MSWERDIKAWERDKYFSHVPSVLPYKVDIIDSFIFYP